MVKYYCWGGDNHRNHIVIKTADKICFVAESTAGYPGNNSIPGHPDLRHPQGWNNGSQVSMLATALSAHALSIAPGELVVEIDADGVMYTHVLDVTHSSEYQEQAQQMRNDLLSKIIE